MVSMYNFCANAWVRGVHGANDCIKHGSCLCSGYPPFSCGHRVAAGPALTVAATAHADTNDSKFLAMLKSEGITDHVSPAHAIEAAHSVCQKLDAGETPTAVANDVLNSSAMPAYHCGYFVGASIDTYCPRRKPEISGNS